MAEQLLYRVIFVNQGKVFEFYAKNVFQGGLHGFVEVEGLVFGETSTLVVDPSEERLKAEFSGVERTYIPMHAVIRIDQVAKRGTAKISKLGEKGDKVMPFPGTFLPVDGPDKG